MIGKPLQIGAVDLSTNMLLAPMAGYCDLAWRLTCRSFGGVGLACTDLLSPHGLLRGTQHSLDLAKTNDQDKPVGMQLYGSDPEIMAEGAKWAAEHGATIAAHLADAGDVAAPSPRPEAPMHDADLTHRVVERFLRRAAGLASIDFPPRPTYASAAVPGKRTRSVEPSGDATRPARTEAEPVIPRPARAFPGASGRTHPSEGLVPSESPRGGQAGRVETEQHR